MRTQEKAAWAMADEGQEAQLLAEVAEALRAALVAPSSTPAARSFVEAVQAVLTEERYAADVATSITRQFNQASESTIKALLDAIGWDLFEALVPHTAESEEVRQLCGTVVNGCPVRECHLMCMEALSTPGRLSSHAAYFVIGHLLPHVLRRLPASKRASFVSPPFEASLDRALTCVDQHTAMQQAHDNTPPTQDDEGAPQPDKDKGRWDGVIAALDLVTALLTPPRQVWTPDADPPATDGITLHELGHVVGLLLHLLGHCLLPCYPPPLSPTPSPPLVARLLSLLSLCLTLPQSPLTIETFLVHHTRARYNATTTDKQDGVVLCESCVSNGRLAWSPSGVSVACYHLLILSHGPPLPSPLSPAYVATLAAPSIALLLKAPLLSAQGLVGVEWLLKLLPPPTGPLPLTGPLTLTHPRTTVEGVEEEASWVCMCRALTGCIVFLSEEEQRRRAYKALQGTFALLHDHSRFLVLHALLVVKPSFSQTMTALLIGLAQKATITAFAHRHTLASYRSPFTTPKVHGLYEKHLWGYCDKPASAFVSLSSEANEGSGELDTLMAGLNLYRFLLLKDKDQEGGCTGVWLPDRTTVALSKLQALQSTLTQALQSSGGQSFRLQMVDEVVSHSLLPLLRGEPQNDTLPPPPPIVSRSST